METGHLLQVLVVAIFSDAFHEADVVVRAETSEKNSTNHVIHQALVIQRPMDVFTHVKLHYKPTLSSSSNSNFRHHDTCDDYILFDCICCPNDDSSTTIPSTPELTLPTTLPSSPPPSTTKSTAPPPTTAKPTTAKPTTAKPTTAKPTTAKPTTAKPTTAKPTTKKPTTAKPTTPPPTTVNPTTPEDTIKCPPEYFPIGEECFKAYCDLEVQWQKAQWLCAGDNSYLAEPENSTALALYVFAHNPPKHFWLGAKGDGHQIKWVSGGVVADTEPWGKDQPESVNTRYCLDFRVDQPPMGMSLAVHKCRQALNHYFICETNARIF